MKIHIEKAIPVEGAGTRHIGIFNLDGPIEHTEMGDDATTVIKSLIENTPIDGESVFVVMVQRGEQKKRAPLSVVTPAPIEQAQPYFVEAPEHEIK